MDEKKKRNKVLLQGQRLLMRPGAEGPFAAIIVSLISTSMTSTFCSGANFRALPGCFVGRLGPRPLVNKVP